jgi:ABC-type nitrate/sulfonate/bicarbonate transport system substrate-binding protein
MTGRPPARPGPRESYFELGRIRAGGVRFTVAQQGPRVLLATRALPIQAARDLIALLAAALERAEDWEKARRQAAAAEAARRWIGP